MTDASRSDKLANIRFTHSGDTVTFIARLFQMVYTLSRGRHQLEATEADPVYSLRSEKCSKPKRQLLLTPTAKRFDVSKCL